MKPAIPLFILTINPTAAMLNWPRRVKRKDDRVWKLRFEMKQDRRE